MFYPQMKFEGYFIIFWFYKSNKSKHLQLNLQRKHQQEKNNLLD